MLPSNTPSRFASILHGGKPATHRNQIRPLNIEQIEDIKDRWTQLFSK
jgi:hypothetical protein